MYGIQSNTNLASEIELCQRQNLVKGTSSISPSEVPYSFRDLLKQFPQKKDAESFLEDSIKIDRIYERRFFNGAVVALVIGVALCILGGVSFYQNEMNFSLSLGLEMGVGVASIAIGLCYFLRKRDRRKAKRVSKENFLKILKESETFVMATIDPLTIWKQRSKRLLARIFNKNIGLKDQYLKMEDRELAKRDITAINRNSQKCLSSYKGIKALLITLIVFSFLTMFAFRIFSNGDVKEVATIASFCSIGLCVLNFIYFAIVSKLLKEDLKDTLEIQRELLKQ